MRWPPPAFRELSYEIETVEKIPRNPLARKQLRILVAHSYPARRCRKGGQGTAPQTLPHCRNHRARAHREGSMTRAQKPTAAQKRREQALTRALNAGWWTATNLRHSGFTDSEIAAKRLPTLRMFLHHERKRK